MQFLDTILARVKAAASSIYFFPVLATLVFLGLVAFNINGSSIGVYHNALYGTEVVNEDLLYGTPKSIRSDEWLGWTQNIALQEETGYPSYNHKLGGDGDITKNSYVPAWDWVSIFRPNIWSYFILPFEYAFAFSWWLVMYLLVISCYFFALRLLRGQKLLASLLSISFTLSPFLLWWYQSQLFLPMAYGFLILIISMRIIDREPMPRIRSPLIRNALYVAALIFLGAGLGLTLYPPYALPVFLGVVAFLMGYLINKKVSAGISYPDLLKRLLPFVIASVVVIAIGLLYVLDHREMIEAMRSSAYPGQRRVDSGGLPIFAVLDGFLMPLLQGATKGLHYYTNQSEASNFILLLPFLLIPGLVLQVIEYIRKRKIDWLLLAVHACAALFFIRALVPIDSFLYQALLLDRVPHARLRSGMGFIGIIQLMLLIRKVDQLKLSARKQYIYAAIFGVISFIILILVGLYVKHHYPIFLNSYVLLVVLATAFTAIIVTFLAGKKLIGAALLLIFSIGSSFQIVPLYRGLDFVQESKIVNKIKEVSKPSDNWITTDNLYYINLPMVAGRGLVSGSQYYPDPELWSQVGGEKYKQVYNRQARAVYVTDPDMEKKMRLIRPNYFQLKFECSEFLYRHVDYVLAIEPMGNSCTHLVDKVTYPKETFYIYSIKNTTEK